MHASRSRARTLAVACAALLALAGCRDQGATPDPSPVTDSPERAAAELADGLSASDLSTVEFYGASSAETDAAFESLVSGMGEVHPDVGVAALSVAQDTATVTLRYQWHFAGVPESWTYDTAAALRRDDGRWVTAWSPSLVYTELDDRSRLTQRRLYPDRGDLLGADGEALMTLRPVVRIGLDKSALQPEEAERSARRLAALVDIDPGAYAEKVAGYGPEAFVEAIVLRSTARDRPANAAVHAIPGGLAIEGEQVLAPTADFARPVLGAVGEATEEIIDSSGGSIVAGDQVGLSGLQRRYDAVMRGTPGVQVRMVDAEPRPGPTASPTPTGSEPSVRVDPRAPETLFNIDPVDGQDLETTLNRYLQQRAERVLRGTKPASALVAIRPSTGEVLAIANHNSNGQSIATVGEFPPGSTFKVASALGLLRAGLTPTSEVSCPDSITVDGRRYENYDDYPASGTGRITLARALANSCNTAFIDQRDKLGSAGLAEAAGSLGAGVDYDVGFPSYFGSIPAPTTQTAAAEAAIGQGRVTASPLAMAAMAASVQARTTVIPHLLVGQQVQPTAKPLTKAEARQLWSMMRGVVTQGSAEFLAAEPGDPIIAKTGTAEHGAKAPYDTHAWMIAAQGDLAVAVFVSDGQSGSKTAGPLLRQFLAAAR